MSIFEIHQPWKPTPAGLEAFKLAVEAWKLHETTPQVKDNLGLIAQDAWMETCEIVLDELLADKRKRESAR